MKNIFNSQQVNIFNETSVSQDYAVLCNALYERELQSLSQQANPSFIQRKLKGLSHNIKRAAEELMQQDSPLGIDIHNASWQSKQAAKCMANRCDSETTEHWYQSNARLALIVPVYVSHFGIENIELDCINRVEKESGRIQLNKHNWFKLDGTSETACDKTQKGMIVRRLLKPNKVLFGAACSGHTWDHKGKSQPRTLSLREIMLSSTINWKTFK